MHTYADSVLNVAGHSVAYLTVLAVQLSYFG